MPDGALDRFLALRAAFVLAAPPDPALGLCHALADAVDDALCAALPAEASNVALVAVGGYGRRELCLYSDIDLMLLYRGRLPAGLTDAVFYPLWDAGLKVGHSVRTVPEALAAADDRLETLTALLDLRLVAGPARLTEELAAGLHARVVRRGPALAAELRAAVDARRAAEPYQLLETNLKDGRGGLRTYQRRRWLRAVEGATRTDADAAASTADPRAMPAHGTVLAARNALHAVAARPQDTWLMELQGPACAWLGVDADAWCARLYLALREIDRRFDEPAAPETEYRATRQQAGRRLGRLLPRRGQPPPSGAAPTGSEPAGSAIATSGRSVLGYAGALAQRSAAAVRLSPAAGAAVASASGASWTNADRTGLVALLSSGERGGLLFDDLARLGWLERALPEWRHVRGLTQHTPFHLHPVDVHLWRTVAEAVALAEGHAEERWCREVAGGLGGLDDLLIAALLHDIGKGWPGDHAETGAAAAAAICRRTGWDPDVAHSVTTAVRHHLLLPRVATRRDIADDLVVEGVANQIGRVRTLRVLCLLSVADSRATGPAVWSPWKASLVRALYGRVLTVLEARSGATPLTAAEPSAIEHLLAQAGDRFPVDTVLRHIEAMPPGYTRAFGADDLLRHLRVMEPSPDEGDLRLDVREDGAAHDLALGLRDRPGLIALVAGVLALHNLSIVEARFFTRSDGVALQALQAVDALSNAASDDRWGRVARDVRLALSGELPLERRLEEKVRAYRRTGRARGHAEVRVEQEASGEYTVLEVHAIDRVGLLYAITRTLFGCGLDVRFAKIDTEGHNVVDVFYVCAAGGRPLRDGERIRELRAALLAAIEG